MAGLQQWIQSQMGSAGMGSGSANPGASMFGPVSPATMNTVNNMASMAPLSGTPPSLDPTGLTSTSTDDQLTQQILLNLSKSNQTNPWALALMGAQGPADILLQKELGNKELAGMAGGHTAGGGQMGPLQIGASAQPASPISEAALIEALI